MHQYLWIAIAATIVVIGAHGILFWWFLCKKDNSDPKNEEPEDR